MQGERRSGGLWRILGLAVCAWTAIAALFAAMSYAKGLLAGRPDSLPELAALIWLSWIFLAFATVPLAVLVRRFPMERGRRAASIAVMAAATLALLLLMAAWDTAVVRVSASFFDIRPAFGNLASATTLRLFQELLVRNSAVTLLALLGTVATLQAFAYYLRARERELAASQLEAQLTGARLAALQAQLHPHFLFNTLNSIAELVHADPEAAERMIVLLSDLLRATLSAGSSQEVPLRQELGLLERYLEIEQMRFSDRLTVAVDAAGDTLDALVPSLILQPLVENAIRHGIAPRRAPGQVVVRARRVDSALSLEVVDDGVGLTARAGRERTANGVGLANTRERLRQLYGDRCSFELTANSGGGLTARATLPLRRGDPRSLAATGAA